MSAPVPRSGSRCTPSDPARGAAIDWPAIERDYRAGVLSLRELAAAHGITHGAINKRAKRDGWTRSLGERIKARAEVLVSRALVSATVSADALVTERQIIEANATRIAQVRGEHRADIRRMRDLAASLLAEVEAQTVDADLMRRLGELMKSPDERGLDKLSEAYRKVISTPGRVETMKKLVETMRCCIAMEREAYGLDAAAGSGAENPLVTLLAGMRRSTLPVVYEVPPEVGL